MEEHPALTRKVEGSSPSSSATPTCEACGAPLRIGDFPFCPHGKGVHGIFPPTDWRKGLKGSK